MWQVTDQTEATSFVAELLKCRNCVQHFIVYERQKFSKSKARMIYKDLRESYSLLSRKNSILRVAIDVLDISQLSDIYQMKMYAGPDSGLPRFLLVLQNTPLQQNVILSLGRKPIT